MSQKKKDGTEYKPKSKFGNKTKPKGPKKKKPEELAISPQEIDQILDDISFGISISQACRNAKVKRTTFRAIVWKDEALHVRYAHARLKCADSQFEGIEKLEQQLLDGEIDHQTYRALMDSMKWRLARMRPDSYGDMKSIDHTSSDRTMTPNKVEIIVLEEKE